MRQRNEADVSDNEPSDTVRVGIRVGAGFGQLPTLRALTETTLLVADLALDEVCDVQLAIDEIATNLITGAKSDSSVACEFAFRNGRLSVSVTALLAQPQVIDEHAFGWHVVRTVTESLNVDIGPFDRTSGGHPTAVEFARTCRIIDA